MVTDMTTIFRPLGDLPPSAAGPPRHAVAFAASAGGLAALSQVLSALPSDFAAAILVVQHLDPNHRSWMAEILTRRTGLRVAQARGGERLAAGTVLIAPPGHHLLVGADGALSLSDTARIQYSRPSADVVFTSLAESWGDGAIAVVLSGKGMDGADGVRAIKRHGGTVIAQDEAAEFGGMPRAAIRTGLADFVLPLESIASTLMKLTAGGIA
jgi:two-component system chemotaxis response regulator CheB